MNLFMDARRRFSAPVRPDWKHDTEVAYEHWMADQSDDAMDGIVRAIAPGIYFISYRYTDTGSGFTREEAFAHGCERIPYSVRKFSPELSPRGTSEVASFIMWSSEMSMMKALRCARERAEHECSLDEFDLSTMPAFSESDSYDGRKPVDEVLSEAMESMSPSDRRIVRWKLIDDMTWEEVLAESRGAGDTRSSAEAIRMRFREHIRPKLMEKFRREGYDAP